MKNENYENYRLSIVVPVYNEENGIKPFLDRTEAVVEKLGFDFLPDIDKR